MKTKLTLTVDTESVAKIKRFAKRKGTSVSSLFEQWSIRTAAGDETPHLSSRLRGRWKSKSSHEGDPRLDFLLAKHRK